MTSEPAFAPLTPERRRAMTRQHLLDAAAIVFTRNGFHGSTLDEVAATAGFTKGAVYSNFKSKDELFLALVVYSRRNPEAAAKLAASARRTRALVTEMVEREYASVGNTPRYPTSHLAEISLALFSGLGIDRLVDPDSVTDATLDTVLMY